MISFAAKILKVNNWQACQYLVEAFSLPVSLSGQVDNREAIERRKRERQEKQAQEQRFKTARAAEINQLKRWEQIYSQVIEKRLFPAFSDLWGFTIMEREKVSYRLDVLCGISGDRVAQEELLTESGWKL